MDSFLLSVCLSFFFLSFFVSFDYSLVVSVVLLLHLWEKRFMMRIEKKKKEAKNVFHLLLFRVRCCFLGSLPRKKERNDKNDKRKKNEGK
jgi:hypothetical protein